MRQMQPVLWTKGVLLTPQHLQAQDRFLEDLLEFQLSSLVFCPWGFHRLEIDREALAAGTLAIHAASGIFPDGLLFDMPGSDATPPPKSLQGLLGPDQDAMDVYLAIPEYRSGGQNVSGSVASGPADRDTRYRAEESLRRDETTGLAERPIQVARKNFRLLAQGESLEGHQLLRLARVLRAPTGGFQLDARFVPPLLSIGANDYVRSIARRLVEILSARSAELAGTRRQKNLSLADFGIADVASFWLLYTIDTHFPKLRHLYEAPQAHPAELFETMLALAGALTTFSSTIHPRDFPRYEHDDLTACLTRLDDQLRELLDTVVPSNTASLPLKRVQPYVYAAALDQDRYLAAPQIYLAMAVEGRATDVAQRAPMLLKVSAAGQIDHLIRQALVGATLTHVPHPTATVPVKLQYQYFLIQKSGPEWDAIARARNIAVYVPADFPEPQLEVVIVLA